MQEGAVLRDRYQLQRLIGRGGMADVYLALDLRRQVEVAIKVLREDLAEDPEFVTRFQREAEALARLDHPNVVRFYSFERQANSAFIVMDYVAGNTLRGRLMEAGGPLPLDEVTRIMRQITAALYYAHSQGYVHRDIKPGNIMFKEDGTALLSDFGIARVAEGTTMTMGPIGTPAYMSPEQILGRPVDARTDIYSLGVVLYEMVTGRRPFLGETGTGTSTTDRIRQEHLHAQPPDPRRFNPSLPPAAVSVLMTALAKDPAQRFQDVISFGQAWLQAVGPMLGQAAATGVRPSGPATAATFPGQPRTMTPPRQSPAGPTAVYQAQPATPTWQPQPVPAAPPKGRNWTLWVVLGAVAILGGGAIICVAALGLFKPSPSGTPTAPPTALAKLTSPTSTLEPAPTQAAPTEAAPTEAAPTEAAPTETSVPPAQDTPPPADQGLGDQILVKADGSGDVATLEEAISKAPSGATVTLEPGTYYLSAPLQIRQPLSLVGAGIDKTVIASDAAGQVVWYSGLGQFSAKGITFQHTGASAANVFAVSGGEVSFSDCRFTGAVWDKQQKKGGVGLWLYGFTTGEVRQCQADGNELQGFSISGSAKPLLDSNVSFQNSSGIAYWDNAAGVASNNQCYGNELDGIVMEDRSAPTLKANHCYENKDSGIAYWGDSGGEAANNDCSGNAINGISVSERAKPRLEANTCSKNSNSGIRYYDSSGGLAAGNQCIGNQQNGIAVTGQANTTLQKNTCSDNVYHGIYIADQAAPAIEGNTCERNLDTGIAFFGSSSGSADGNTCSGNQAYGIFVKSTANPTLGQNNCSGNATGDIYDQRNGG